MEKKSLEEMVRKIAETRIIDKQTTPHHEISLHTYGMEDAVCMIYGIEHAELNKMVSAYTEELEAQYPWLRDNK